MSNKIESIHVAPTSVSRTLPGRFEETLRGATAGLVRGVADTVDLAAPYVPAGTIVSAAVRTGANALAGAVAGSTGGTAASAAAAGSTSEDDLLSATKALQQQSQTFNLQYLQLQEDMQRENREFTALTNVMKTKHESAKAAIQNIH